MFKQISRNELTEVDLHMPKSPEIIEKVWGWEVIIANKELYCAKILVLKKNYQCSMHYHINKDETFYFMEGLCLFEWGNQKDIKKYVVSGGRSIYLPPKTEHRFNGISTNTRIFEVSTYHDDNDSIRLTQSQYVKNGSEEWEKYPLWCSLYSV